MPAAEFIPSIRAPFARLHAAILALVHVAMVEKPAFLNTNTESWITGDKHQVLVVSTRGQKKTTKD